MNHYSPIGYIRFDGASISVYNNWEEPLFRIKDVAKLIGYRVDSSSQLLAFCLEKDYLKGYCYLANKGRGSGAKQCTFVTEQGLYKILARTQTPTASKWLEIVTREIIKQRKAANRTITEQFDLWDEEAERIWYDEETGKMMEAINVPGGDVEIREYKEPEEPQQLSLMGDAYGFGYKY